MSRTDSGPIRWTMICPAAESKGAGPKPLIALKVGRSIAEEAEKLAPDRVTTLRIRFPFLSVRQTLIPAIGRLKCAVRRRAILFDHAKLSLTAKGNDLLSQGPFQEDTRLLTRRHNRATQIRLRFISISRSRRKLRPRTVRRL